jgi:hypothetical protein
LSPTYWARIQSSLGYQEMEYRFRSYRREEEDATLWARWMERKSIS